MNEGTKKKVRQKTERNKEGRNKEHLLCIKEGRNKKHLLCDMMKGQRRK